MIKHYQSEFGNTRGNCLQACLATVLDLPLEAVPHFATEGSEWFNTLNRWLNKNHNMGAIYCSPLNPGTLEVMATSDGRYLVGGKAENGNPHVVVYHQGKLWHDPMPGGEGLKEEEGIIVLFSLLKPTGRLV
jgi:hypothetical protein